MRKKIMRIIRNERTGWKHEIKNRWELAGERRFLKRCVGLGEFRVEKEKKREINDGKKEEKDKVSKKC